MTSGTPDNPDERFLFTENNPEREFMAAAHLSGSYRALLGYNDELANDCLNAAKELYANAGDVEAEVIVNAYDTYEFVLPKKED